MRKVLLSLLILTFLLFNNKSVQAYTIKSYEEKILNNFALTPVKVEFSAKPGSRKTKYITVVNRLGKTYNFDVEVQDFEGTLDPDVPLRFLGNIKSSWSAKDWLTPEIDKFTLRQGERIKFAVKIKLPKKALIGGHYAVLFITIHSKSRKKKNRANIATSSRAGTLFLIKIPGKIKEEGRLRSFTSVYKTYLKGPVNFNTIFQNDGNIHLKPQGRIIIRNQLGQVVKRIPVKPWIILPQSVRKSISTWDENLMLRLGKYTAELKLKYGQKHKKIISAKTTFFVMPLKLIFVAVGLIMGLTFIIYYFSTIVDTLKKLFKRRSA